MHQSLLANISQRLPITGFSRCHVALEARIGELELCGVFEQLEQLQLVVNSCSRIIQISTIYRHYHRLSMAGTWYMFY